MTWGSPVLADLGAFVRQDGVGASIQAFLVRSASAEAEAGVGAYRRRSGRCFWWGRRNDRRRPGGCGDAGPQVGPFVSDGASHVAWRIVVHEVAAAVVERGGPSIDPGYIDHSRRGEADYPPEKVLELLAAVFGVPAGYFTDDTMAEHIDAELAVLTAMRDGRARVRVCPRAGAGEFFC